MISYRASSDKNHVIVVAELVWIFTHKDLRAIATASFTLRVTVNRSFVPVFHQPPYAFIFKSRLDYGNRYGPG